MAYFLLFYSCVIPKLELWALYNPLLTRWFLRRNEILIPLKAGADEEIRVSPVNFKCSEQATPTRRSSAKTCF